MGERKYEKQAICSSRVSSHKTCTNYKGKKKTAQWRNLAATTLTRWRSVSRERHALVCCARKGPTALLWFSGPNCLNSDKSKVKNVFNVQLPSKVSRKVSWRMWHCHRMEETKETSPPNAMWDVWLDPGPGKAHL